MCYGSRGAFREHWIRELWHHRVQAYSCQCLAGSLGCPNDMSIFNILSAEYVPTWNGQNIEVKLGVIVKKKIFFFFFFIVFVSTDPNGCALLSVQTITDNSFIYLPSCIMMIVVSHVLPWCACKMAITDAGVLTFPQLDKFLQCGFVTLGPSTIAQDTECCLFCLHCFFYTLFIFARHTTKLRGLRHFVLSCACSIHNSVTVREM